MNEQIGNHGPLSTLSNKIIWHFSFKEPDIRFWCSALTVKVGISIRSMTRALQEMGVLKRAGERNLVHTVLPNHGKWPHYRIERWSRNFGPVVKMDRLMRKTIQNDETKEPFT